MKLVWYTMLALICLLGASLPAGAQNQVPPASITSRTDLVLVPVVVTDKRGNHIPSLTNGDFRLEEEGKPQSLARLEEINATKTPMRRPAGPVPNSFTNELVGDPSSRVLVIVALDFLNTSWADGVFARRALLKYLSESVNENTLVSLVTIDHTGLHQIHDFTTNAAVLVAALKRVATSTVRLDTSEQQAQTEGMKAQEQATRAEAGALSRLLDPDTIKLLAQPRIINAQTAASREAFAARTTLEAMQHLAQAYAAVPGRKALIWATGSFPFLTNDPNEMSYAGLSPELYQRTFQMLDDANIAAYPIDVRGLSPKPADQYDPNRPQDMSRSIATRAAILRASEIPDPESLRLLSLATLRSFAEMTGGEAFYNANDLQQCMVHATNDSASYYLLSYYLNKDSVKKSGWHKLRVTVAREGAEVRARRGFFVTKATLDPERTRRVDEQVALDSPIDYTAMPLLLTWKEIQTGQKKNKANFLLQVAPEVIRIQDNKINLDFLGVAKNDKGETVGQFSQNLASNLGPDGLKQIQTGGITYTNALQLPAGDYNVRVVVRDNFTGMMGSVLAPLKVQ